MVENIEQIRTRYEAFWDGKAIGRPLVAVTAPPRSGDPGPLPFPFPKGAPVEEIYAWYTDVETVLENFEFRLKNTHYAGDALPVFFPMSTALAAIQAGYMGGAYTISPTGSVWCDHTLDWDNAGQFAFDPDNKWWVATKTLLDAAGKRFSGRAILGIPDMQGGGQILDSLRGSQNLLMDFFDAPDEVKKFMPVIDEAFERYWSECNEILLKYQDSYIDWLGTWSSRSMVTVECDVSVMVSPDQFNEFFLPSLERQINFVDRSIYHLDGSGQICHLDTLLSLEKLNGIQWVPEPSNKDIQRFMPMLKRIRDTGKLLVLVQSALESTDDIKRVLDELGPEGIYMYYHCECADEADALIDSL